MMMMIVMMEAMKKLYNADDNADAFDDYNDMMFCSCLSKFVYIHLFLNFFQISNM